MPAHLLKSLGGVIPQLDAISGGGGGNACQELLTNSEVIAEKFHGCSFLFAKVAAALQRPPVLTLTLAFDLTLALAL